MLALVPLSLAISKFRWGEGLLQAVRHPIKSVRVRHCTVYYVAAPDSVEFGRTTGKNNIEVETMNFYKYVRSSDF
jgi:hypothetical protein